MTCPQCNSPKARWYDGALGYEAVRCEECHIETDMNSGATCPIEDDKENL